jgi:hypothetical protein
MTVTLACGVSLTKGHPSLPGGSEGARGIRILLTFSLRVWRIALRLLRGRSHGSLMTTDCSAKGDWEGSELWWW